MKSRLWALAVSTITFLVFIGLRFGTPLADSQPLVVAGSLCFCAAVVIRHAYPSWAALGVGGWSSLAFWTFLLWAAYLEASTGGTAASPLSEALAMFLAAFLGAWLTGRMRRGRPHPAPTEAEAGAGSRSIKGTRYLIRRN